ncbi:putative AT-rich interactive domain-containing protein 5B isoform X3 [Apostichopus japonicus]|uniref:Putative AT-rich interactive domain-containing protein 5B isoform X3 n=1 Tax=Stichopus japonicus TaxID=307972 RepID=A0A2G8KN89_STIJA|nr:putative AT-rich interactive domain-containing protein 5B isoform X3 [Apostichopus japonicus]
MSEYHGKYGSWDVKWKMLSLGDFFFVRCSQNEPLCIAELQLLWETKNSEGVKLSSSRLYFLPECTPEGRMEWHGEDEVLAVRDKVVLKIDDLTDWIVSDVDWSHGGPTIWRGSCIPRKEKQQAIKPSAQKAEEQNLMKMTKIRAKSLFLVTTAPKLKGRPRKKRSSTMEDGVEVKKGSKATVKKEKEVQPLRRTRRKRTKLGLQRKKAESKEEAEFLEKLYKFMQDRSTPIERLPCLGFKQINLFHFFKTTEDYGGYDNITSQRLWKKVYIELGGNPGCTSAATCTRRHYERYIQPYANHVNNNETGKTSKPKLKKRKKTKGKEIQNESKQEEKMPRPRKKVKKVREHLEELKQLKKLREEQQQNGLHLVTDLSTVQPSSLPGHTVDANFNIERTKGMLNSLAVSMLHENQLLHPNDLRHKLNSKHQVRAKGLIRKVEMEPENGNDLTLHNRESPSERTPEKSSSPSMASRPSVIQHTQQSQENLPGKGDRRSPYHQAVQPSDLILRKLAQEMQNNSESIKAAKTASDLQLNKFPRPFVFPSGVPFIRPFVPYHMMMRANMPLMSFQHDLPAATGSGSVRYPQVVHQIK